MTQWETLDQPIINDPPRVILNRATGPVTQLQIYHPKLIDTIVCCKFNDGKYYEGKVTNYDAINKFYQIEYLDGDTKDYNHAKMRHYKKSVQEYSTPNKAKYACYMFANKFDKIIFFIASI